MSNYATSNAVSINFNYIMSFTIPTQSFPNQNQLVLFSTIASIKPIVSVKGGIATGNAVYQSLGRRNRPAGR